MSMTLFWTKHHHSPSHRTIIFFGVGRLFSIVRCFFCLFRSSLLGILTNGICSVSSCPSLGTVVNWRQGNINHILSFHFPASSPSRVNFIWLKTCLTMMGVGSRYWSTYYALPFFFFLSLAPFIEKTKFFYFISVSFGLLLLRMATLTPREGALRRKKKKKRERWKTGTLIAW